MQFHQNKSTEQSVRKSATSKPTEDWVAFCLIAEEHRRAPRGTFCWLVKGDPDQGIARVRVMYKDASGDYQRLYISPSLLSEWGVGSGMPDFISRECKRWPKEREEDARQFANRMGSTCWI